MTIYRDKFIQYNFEKSLWIKGFVCDFKIHHIDFETKSVEIEDLSINKKFVFKNIETITFSDLTLSSNNQLPIITCLDVLYVDAPRLGISYTIPVSDLTRNDQPLKSAITIDSVSNPKGGKAIFDAEKNLIKFTPQLTHKDIMSFCYYAKENNQISADCTPVRLIEPDMPKDPCFADAWWLHATNIAQCWRYYTGKNISVGVIEVNVYFKHDDMQVQRALKASLDSLSGVQVELCGHSLSVAGVIGAKRNGEYAIGVAYDANLYSYDLLISKGIDYTALAELILGNDHDILSNSVPLGAWFTPLPLYGKAYADLFNKAAEQGRGGKGTTSVFASHNHGDLGESSDYSYYLNSPYIIVVGGVSKPKELFFRDTEDRDLHSWGANILVSAPWNNIDVLSITDLSFEERFTYKSTVTKKAGGTSFSTPIVSGIVALMYEANSQLGWRDVQEILAICAHYVPVERKIDHEWLSYWRINNASHWNGGGMHVSHLYGFGLVDAYCATSFARTWPLTSISKNFIHVSKDYRHKDKLEKVWDIASFTQEFPIEYAELKFVGGFSNITMASINLVSPSMTISHLMDQPSINPLDGKPASFCELKESLVTTQMTQGWSLGSVHFRGESTKGVWKLHTSDPDGISSVTLTLYGNHNANVQLVYTNEFSWMIQRMEQALDKLKTGLKISTKVDQPLAYLTVRELKEKLDSDQLSRQMIEGGILVLNDNPANQISVDIPSPKLSVGEAVKKLEEAIVARKTIKKGASILNTAGVYDGVTINLKDHSGTIDGQKVTFMQDHSITKIITGDGDDRITVDLKGAFEITAGCGYNVIDLFGGKSTVYLAPTNCKVKHDTIKNFGLFDKIIIPLLQNIIPKVEDKEIKVGGHSLATLQETHYDLFCSFKEAAWECSAICGDLQLMRIDDSYKCHLPIVGVCKATDRVE